MTKTETYKAKCMNCSWVGKKKKDAEALEMITCPKCYGRMVVVDGTAQ